MESVEREIRGRAQALNDIAASALDGLSEEKVRPHRMFHLNVWTYIMSIPLEPAGVQRCPACEGRLCGVCGQCHDIDRRDYLHQPACPLEKSTPKGDSPCNAWYEAYFYLRLAGEAILRE